MKSETDQDTNATPDLLTFDLPSLTAQMKQEESWAKSGRSARTLHKTSGMRLVLNAMKAGTEIKPHHANGPISVHCIEGQLKFNTDNESVTLQSGEMLYLQENIRHSVEAIEESSFLLTIAHLNTPEAAEK